MTFRLSLFVFALGLAFGQAPSIHAQVLPAKDARTGGPRTLHTKWAFPHVASGGAWKARAAAIRLQAKVALGLYPMPKRTPLNPVITGRIDRDSPGLLPLRQSLPAQAED